MEVEVTYVQDGFLTNDVLQEMVSPVLPGEGQVGGGTALVPPAKGPARLGSPEADLGLRQCLCPILPAPLAYAPAYSRSQGVGVSSLGSVGE